MLFASKCSLYIDLPFLQLHVKDLVPKKLKLCLYSVGSSTYIRWRFGRAINPSSGPVSRWNRESWKWSDCGWINSKWLDCILWFGHHCHRVIGHRECFQIEGGSTKLHCRRNEEVINWQLCVRSFFFYTWDLQAINCYYCLLSSSVIFNDFESVNFDYPHRGCILWYHCLGLVLLLPLPKVNR